MALLIFLQPRRTKNMENPTGHREPTFKKIRAVEHLRRIMADQFYKLDRASKDKTAKIAWCTSVGPAELLLSLGFLVYYPENHGALLGATRTANDYIPAANAVGFSPDICSYLSSDIGAFIKKETPLAKQYPGLESVPRPDVLVYNTNQCRDVQDWFGWYARELHVPALGIATPRSITSVGPEHLALIAKQVEALIPPLEKISGRKFDIDRLRAVVDLSRQGTELWKKVLETNRSVPAPLSFFDAVIHMGPAVILRGSPEAIEYYRVLLAEMEGRRTDHEGAVDGERFRLYWDGMPIWGKLRDLAELFISLKTSVVASTYCNSWIFEGFDPADPFLSLARAYTEIFIVRDENFREAYIQDMVQKYGAHGVIFHDAKTCPNNSNNRYGLPERLKARLGLPVLTINGDLNDQRCFSEEQTRTNIEALIENMQDDRSSHHA